METVLDEGGGVLFLVPEVSLAPQTVARLRACFSKKEANVVVWHDHLSEGERLDAWRNLASGKARIVENGANQRFAPRTEFKIDRSG